jgi:hypothetical protein
MTGSAHLVDITRIYQGSDGDATRALYARLEALGPAGACAVNLFRAQKSSERAKVYRGGARGKGSYRGMAYDRKQWAIDNLGAALTEHAEALGIGWGWGLDKAQPVHCWVIYIDLPTGQVSFHATSRGIGPSYAGEWDGVPGHSPDRILRFVARLLDGRVEAAP